MNDFITKSLLDSQAIPLLSSYPEHRSVGKNNLDDALITAITDKEKESLFINEDQELANYFKKNRSDYKWNQPRYDGIVFHCVDKKMAKQAKRLLKKFPKEKWTDVLNFTFNKSGVENVIINCGTFTLGQNEYVDKFVFKQKNNAVVLSHPFTVVMGKKENRPEYYQEVIDQVRKDYQTEHLARWERRLRASGKVEIIEEVLKTVNNN